MDEAALRNALLGSIDGGQAYMTFDEAIADFPPEHYNTRPANVPYTFWHLLEHIRLTALDIADYTVGETYEELEWPRDYWPDASATAGEDDWNATIAGFRETMATLRQLVTDPETDLTALARHAGGNEKHTIAREILVTTDHNAYHTGEFAILRQVMGIWPEGHG
jgi:hypothetical protein